MGRKRLLTTPEQTYKSWWKAMEMFVCIKASSSGRNLRSTGITTCWYQSCTLVTSNSGICVEFWGLYMSASSDRVQFIRNWVRVALRISVAFLCRKNKDSDLFFLAVLQVQSGCVLCLYLTCESRKLMNEAADRPEHPHKIFYHLEMKK